MAKIEAGTMVTATSWFGTITGEVLCDYREGDTEILILDDMGGAANIRNWEGTKTRLVTNTWKIEKQ